MSLILDTSTYMYWLNVSSLCLRLMYEMQDHCFFQNIFMLLKNMRKQDQNLNLPPASTLFSLVPSPLVLQLMRSGAI